ncbi:unannotated protein [freshwater metagenome]|uniref:Unannotated protein n=1 Tax=freshwater metagenome TaxID=449393 RepID=A0A6J6NCW5_9ZZZZ
MATDTNAGALGPMNHDRGVPANIASDLSFDGFVAGEPGFKFRGNGVDVVGAAQAGDSDISLGRPPKQRQH